MRQAKQPSLRAARTMKQTPIKTIKTAPIPKPTNKPKPNRLKERHKEKRHRGLNFKDGISVCAVQYIIDHPEMTNGDLARDLDLSITTIRNYREALGIPCPYKPGERRPSPESLVRRAGYDPQKAAALLELYGFEDMTYKQVVEMCEKEAVR